MNATTLLYQSAGKPHIDGLIDFPECACWLCGSPCSSGKLTKSQIKRTFTDIDFARAPGSGHVCAACVYSMSERDPTLTALTQKDKLQRMRNYSHIVKDGAWHPLSKAQKAEMQALLLDGDFPQLAVIAVSGQKHLIFKARTNPPRATYGYVQIEESGAYLGQAEIQDDLYLVEFLYAEFSKKEIETGEYLMRRISKFGVEAWDRCEQIIRKMRGGARLDLALFLAQRRDDAKGRFKARSSVASFLDLGGDTDGLQSEVRAQHLGAVSGSDSGVGVHGQSGEIRQLPLL